MQFPGKRAVFAPFMEDTALLWDKKQGGKWLKKAGTGGMAPGMAKKHRFQAILVGIRAKVLRWHCRCYGYWYDDYD